MKNIVQQRPERCVQALFDLIFNIRMDVYYPDRARSTLTHVALLLAAYSPSFHGVVVKYTLRVDDSKLRTGGLYDGTKEINRLTGG